MQQLSENCHEYVNSWREKQKAAAVVAGDIIPAMARGWESKSVEDQQAEAAAPATKPKPQLTPEQLANQQKQQGLQLSRQRVLQQLQSAQNPNHRKMLEQALEDLDRQITRLG
jgi:hypothetical protein